MYLASPNFRHIAIYFNKVTLINDITKLFIQKKENKKKRTSSQTVRFKPNPRNRLVWHF